jgi:type II secretory pathway pseudopilin PulG
VDRSPLICPRPPRHAQRGSGLIDVLVAMLVLSGAVAGLARLQALALREAAEARARSEAAMLARAKLDELRAYSQLAVGTLGIDGSDEIAGVESFHRSWTASPRYFCEPDAPPSITPCASGLSPPQPALLALSVTIGWQDRDGDPRRFVLDSNVAAPISRGPPHPAR